MSASDTAAAILSTATSPAPSPASTTEAPDTTPDAPLQTQDVADTSTPSPSEGEGGGGGAVPSDGQQPTSVPSTQQLRAALKAFRDGNPEFAQAAKLLNDGYSRYEAYKQVIPSVEEARAIRAQLDIVGGVEGIADMQSTLGAIEETDALLDAGDPRVLDQIFEDSPEGAKKLAPHYLNKLAKADPEVFGKTIQPHLVRALIDSNLPNVLAYLHQKAGDNAEVKGVIQNVIQWFEQQKGMAERSQQDVLSPERDQLAREREELTKERTSEFQRGVSTAVDSHIRQELGTKLRPYATSLQALPEAMRADVARAAINVLAQALEADTAYQTQIKAMMSARKPDREKIIALNRSKVSSLAGSVIEKVVKGYNLAPGKPGTARPAARAADGKFTNTALLKLGAAPKDTDIDWNHQHMSQKSFIQHRAILTEDAAKRRGLASRYVQW